MFENVEEYVPEDKNQEFHFFYNREERLKNAPESVKAYYRGEMKPVTGIRIFFTKQNRFIFFALIFFVAAAWIFTGLNNTRSYAKISGLDCNLQAFSYGDDIYSTLNFKLNPRTVSKNNPQKINVTFYAIDVDDQVSAKEEMSDVFGGQEINLRAKFTDYEIKRIDVIVDIDGTQKELTSFIKR